MSSPSLYSLKFFPIGADIASVVNKAALRLRIGGYRLRIGGYNLRVKFLQVQEYRAQMMRILTLWDQAVMAMKDVIVVGASIESKWVLRLGRGTS
ncbi:hypothetical protein Tco_1011771, partial [Tanacetum coccineum]